MMLGQFVYGIGENVSPPESTNMFND